MRVLLTGANGFTGSYVISELHAEGWEVLPLGHGQGELPRGTVALDLRDESGLRRAIAGFRPNAVIHLAAVPFVAHGDVDQIWETNLLGTSSLLNAIARSGCNPECILLASSANVYGSHAEGSLSETRPPDPSSNYAASKLAMEYLARDWSDRLPIIITRPFNYTGVGQSASFLIPKIVDHCRRRAPLIELGNLDVWRDFSDVRAVAEAYRRLLAAKPAGQVVNICSGRMHSLREILDMAQVASGHNMEVHINPALVRANEVRHLCGDPERLRSLIGDWASPPLAETLAWMMGANG